MSTPFTVLTTGQVLQVKNNMRSSIEAALANIGPLFPGQPHAVFYRQDDISKWKLNLTLLISGYSYMIYVMAGVQPGQIWVQAVRIGDEKKGAVLIDEGTDSPAVLQNQFNDLVLEAIHRLLEN